MTQQADLRQLVYEESVRAPVWVVLLLGLFLGGSAGLVSAVAIRSLIDKPIIEGGAAAAFYVAMIIYTLVDLLLLVNFTNLMVTVSRQSLEIRFGLFYKDIPIADVTGAEVRDYSWATYGGWGLRLALGGRRAWSMIGVPQGVLVNVGAVSYFVSTRSPEALIGAINGAKSAK